MKPVNYYKLLVIPIIILIALLTSLCTPRESQVDSKEVADEKNQENSRHARPARTLKLLLQQLPPLWPKSGFANWQLKKHAIKS